MLRRHVKYLSQSSHPLWCIIYPLPSYPQIFLMCGKSWATRESMCRLNKDLAGTRNWMVKRAIDTDLSRGRWEHILTRRNYTSSPFISWDLRYAFLKTKGWF